MPGQDVTVEGRITLLIGGSGSGKSALAQGIALDAAKECPAPPLYLATMLPEGDDALRRIEKHRQMREGLGFETLEMPRDIGRLSKEVRGRSVLLECISNLLANEMFAPDAFRGEIEAADIVCRECDRLRSASHLVIVTVAADQGAESCSDEIEGYLRALGRINSYLSEIADEVIEVSSGIPVYIKPEKEKAAHTAFFGKEDSVPHKGIVLVYGGYGEDKEGFAKEYCMSGSRREFFSLNEWVRQELAGSDRRQALEKAGACVAGMEDQVVISDETGCGVVPVSEEERALLEYTGMVRNMISERAAAVIRLICGIPVRLK